MTKWISRASVLRIIDAEPVYSDVINEKTYMASQIKDLPTKEETSRPHGEWIFDGVFHGGDNPIDGDMYHCSVCKRSIVTSVKRVTDIFPFCHCGADMRKEGNRNE